MVQKNPLVVIVFSLQLERKTGGKMNGHKTWIVKSQRCNPVVKY